VDVVILSRDDGPLEPRVLDALRQQQEVVTHAFRVIGWRRPEDRHRWETIARARNHARQLGDSPWLMFLDDDVRLGPRCVADLLQTLWKDPRLGAVGANFLGEPRSDGPAPHVAMGATLFRREALSPIHFRWLPNACECRCCCADLRGSGWQVDYAPQAEAVHLRPLPHGAETSAVAQHRSPSRILVAFNRRHLAKFRSHFLPTLRASGNHETVTAVVYGLYPSEQRLLQHTPGVEVIPRSVNGVMPPVRRLDDFQPLLADWPADMPVAYWDAGDVVFQGNLEPLWQISRTHPGKLLAAREPRGYPYNPAVMAWTLSIHDPRSRRRAFQLLTRNPFLNSGFAAGTVAAMRQYLQAAARLRRSRALAGTTDWGDQAALNLYCHSQPDAWREVEEGWNYCLHDREAGEVYTTPTGQLLSRRGTPIHVVHGNACSLRKLALTHAM